MEDEIGPDGKKIRPGINPVMIDELTECNTMLSAQRKKRQVCTVLLINTQKVEQGLEHVLCWFYFMKLSRSLASFISI